MDCVKFTNSAGRVRYGLILDRPVENMARVLWDEWNESLLDIQRPTDKDREQAKIHTSVVFIQRERARGSSPEIVDSAEVVWAEPSMATMVNVMELSRGL